jgi:hypothetical protein
MTDRVARTQEEIDSRRQVVALVTSILAGEMTFMDGAEQIWRLRDKVGGVSDEDPDFEIFMVISSETDHLPLARTRHLWSGSALERLAPELERTEEWARSIASNACNSLVERFKVRD